MAMMKGFSNAFRIPELRKKILITLGLVFVTRLVSQIPTPGVDWRALQSVLETARQSSAGIKILIPPVIAARSKMRALIRMRLALQKRRNLRLHPQKRLYLRRNH